MEIHRTSIAEGGKRPLVDHSIIEGGLRASTVLESQGERKSATSGQSRDRLLVLGIGNVLMGDEGVGIHAARLLEDELRLENVSVLDGGTGGFVLLPYFQSFQTIIILDATMDGNPPGTIAVREPRFASDYPISLSAHDLGLRDLVETAALLAYSPKVYLVTISVTSLQPATLELSSPVAKSLLGVSSLVRSILSQADVPAEHS